MILYILNLEQFEKSEYCEKLSKHKKHHQAGQYLLRVALGEEVYKKAKFATGEHGKPYIKGHPIHYNISHSGQYVVLVVANSEVGVDVQEKKDKRVENMCKRFFSKAEWQAFEACETIEAQEDLFFYIWCRKEAYGKFLGVGLNQQVLQCNVLSEETDPSCDYVEGSMADEQKEMIRLAACNFQDLDTIEGYQISICSRKGENIEKIIRVFEGL